jgi:hypothetical protein
MTGHLNPVKRVSLRWALAFSWTTAKSASGQVKDAIAQYSSADEDASVGEILSVGLAPA